MIMKISDVQRDSVAIIAAIWRVTKNINDNTLVTREVASEITDASEVVTSLMRPYLTSVTATELLLTSITATLLLNLRDAFLASGVDLETKLQDWVLDLAGGDSC